MKRNDWLLIGGAVAAYFVYSEAKKTGKSLVDALSGMLGAPGQAASQFIDRSKETFYQLEQRGYQTYAGAVGEVAQRTVAQENLMQPSVFSELFNRYIGGGAQLTIPGTISNSAFTQPAVLLNPNLSGMAPASGTTWFPAGAAQTVQGALTAASLAAGVGVGSISPQAGGGVIMRGAATPAAPTAAGGGGGGGGTALSGTYSPAPAVNTSFTGTATRSSQAPSSPAPTAAPTVSLASAYARGLM